MKFHKETYGEKKIRKMDINAKLEEQFNSLMNSLKKELIKIEEISAVVLFGSYARGDYSLRHSDIDIMIFIDKDKKNLKLEEKIRKIIIKLSLDKDLSVHALFQYKKIEEEDRSIMLTIANEGKVLFAKKTLVISDNILGLKGYLLIKFDTAGVKPVIKNKLQRFLYGYTIKGKRYKGIVNGETILNAGKGAIIVPEETSSKILHFSQSIGVKAIQKAKFYK